MELKINKEKNTRLSMDFKSYKKKKYKKNLKTSPRLENKNLILEVILKVRL